MRPVTEIHLHHAAAVCSGEQVRAWHRSPTAEGGRGWRDAGYHYAVEPSGAVRLLRRADINPASAGAARNPRAVAVCVLVDGRELGATGHRLHRWWAPLVSLLADLCASYGLGVEAVIEHRDAQTGRSCPGWGREVTEDLREDVQARLVVMLAAEEQERARMRRAVAGRQA